MAECSGNGSVPRPSRLPYYDLIRYFVILAIVKRRYEDMQIAVTAMLPESGLSAF